MICGMFQGYKILLSGIFSPLDHSQEDTAAKIIRNVYPDGSITVSHLVSLFHKLVSQYVLYYILFNYSSPVGIF